MRKTLRTGLARLTLVSVLAAATATATADQAATEFQLADAPLRKSWGPVKAAYFDPRFGDVLVLEDAAGTVRLLAATPGQDPKLLSVLTRGGN